MSNYSDLLNRIKQNDISLNSISTKTWEREEGDPEFNEQLAAIAEALKNNQYVRSFEICTPVGVGMLDITKETAKAISDAMRDNKHIINLKLSNLGPDVARTLADGIKGNKNIIQLEVSNLSQMVARLLTVAIKDNKNITRLELSNLSKEAAGYLSSTITVNKSITHLELSNLTKEAAQTLAGRIKNNQSITHFELSNLTKEAAAELAVAIRGNKSITHFELSNLSREAVAELAVAIRDNKNITSLEFSNLSTEAAAELADGIRDNKNITSLGLSDLSQDVADLLHGLIRMNESIIHLKLSNLSEMVADSLHGPIINNESITDLEVSNLSKEAVAELAVAIRGNKNITHLEVSNLSKEATWALADGIRDNKNITSLEFSNLSKEAVAELADGIRDNKNITHLEVSNLSKEATWALADGIRDNKNITSLELSNLSKEATWALASIIRNNKNITHLEVSNLSHEALSALTYVIQVNKNITSLKLSHLDGPVFQSFVQGIKNCTIITELSVSNIKVNSHADLAILQIFSGKDEVSLKFTENYARILRNDYQELRKLYQTILDLAPVISGITIDGNNKFLKSYAVLIPDVLMSSQMPAQEDNILFLKYLKFSLSVATEKVVGIHTIQMLQEYIVNSKDYEQNIKNIVVEVLLELNWAKMKSSGTEHNYYINKLIYSLLKHSNLDEFGSLVSEEFMVYKSLVKKLLQKNPSFLLGSDSFLGAEDRLMLIEKYLDNKLNQELFSIYFEGGFSEAINAYLRGEIGLQELKKLGSKEEILELCLKGVVLPAVYDVYCAILDNLSIKLKALPVIQNMNTSIIPEVLLAQNGIQKIDPVITQAFKGFYAQSNDVLGYTGTYAIALQKVIDRDSTGLVKLILSIQPHLGISFFENNDIIIKGKSVGGYSNDKNNVIISTKGGTAHTVGTIIHELTHSAMRKIFENAANPYFKKDKASVEYNKIIQDELLKHPLMKERAPFVTQESLYTEDNYPSEVIAYFMGQLAAQLYQHESKPKVIQDEASFLNSFNLQLWVSKYIKPVLEKFIENPFQKEELIKLSEAIEAQADLYTIDLNSSCLMGDGAHLPSEDGVLYYL